MNDGNLFEDPPAGDAPKEEPPALHPRLARAYREAARQVAREGDEAMARRLRPRPGDPRLAECRTFLGALAAARGDGLPILFGVVMRESVVAAHSGRGRGTLPRTLFGGRTMLATGGEARHSLRRSFTVVPGKKGNFPGLPTVMGRLLVLNSLGYDVHVAANGMLFGHRCRMACPWARVLVVELDGASIEEQKQLLERMRPMVAAAVFSGGRSIHMFVPLSRPVRNPMCVRAGDWREFRALRDSGALDSGRGVPGVEAAAEALRRIVVDASGKEPDMRVLANFACLTRPPGFRHGETGRMSVLLHADPFSRWDNPAPRPRTAEDASHVAMETWRTIAEDWNRRTGASMQGASSPPRRTTPNEEEAHSLSHYQPISPPPHPVLSKDDTNRVAGAPRRTFFDDLDDLESLLARGIPARHRRIGLHVAVMNAARALGWLPGSSGSGGWDGARARMMEAWRAVVARTPEGNIGLTAGEAVEDFGRHLDASIGSGGLASFRPRMPDFSGLPPLGDVGVAARRIRRRMADLAGAGMLPAAAGGDRTLRGVATGAARVVAELLWPLARRVPAQCLGGTASILAARIRAMCPGRRHGAVVRWLGEAGILRVARSDYARWDASLGRGRTRLYFVNLPLVAWLAGVRKGELSWAAPKFHGRP